MKKLLAVLVALAMVLSMGIMAFAEYNDFKSPADIAGDEEGYNQFMNLDASDLFNPDFTTMIQQRNEWNNTYWNSDEDRAMTWEEAWGAYYAYLFSNLGVDSATDIIGEIVGSVQGGYVDAGTAISLVGNVAMGGMGGDGETGDMSGIADTVMGIISGIIGGGEVEPEMTVEEYYPVIVDMIANGATAEEIEEKMSEDLVNNVIVYDQVAAIADYVEYYADPAYQDVTDEAVAWMRAINPEDFTGGNGGGFEFPDFGEIDLPIDIGNSEGGSFLDTILGIIGQIGNIFGGGESGNGGNNGGWGGNETIPDTGDVSFVAVAAVAVVAGAAFVLTRKKSDDAE